MKETKDKFKITLKRSDIKDTEQRLRTGEISLVTLLGKQYIVDTEYEPEQFHVRVYPPEFTYKGRQDGHYLSVSANHKGWVKYLLNAYTDVLNDILTKGFGNCIYEIDEDK